MSWMVYINFAIALLCFSAASISGGLPIGMAYVGFGIGYVGLAYFYMGV